MSSTERPPLAALATSPEQQAAEEFLCRRSSFAGATLPREVSDDPIIEDARGRVERAWRAVGDHASSPEMMSLREQALARARQAHARRWFVPANISRRVSVAASLAAVAIVSGIAWFVSPYGPMADSYRTGIGEQRVVELEDHSKVTLDAKTKLRVRFSRDARVVELANGQAQFSVAKDTTRPFKVIAGDHSIVALGTVFTVEYLDDEVNVAMLEGRVAISGGRGRGPSVAEPKVLELSAGEALQVSAAGKVTVTPKADLSAATAWRQGKVIFHDEPLAAAARRINRYSNVQLRVEGEELENVSVSGVFEAGDTRAFAQAVQSYLPVIADYSDPDTIRLSPK